MKKTRCIFGVDLQGGGHEKIYFYTCRNVPVDSPKERIMKTPDGAQIQLFTGAKAQELHEWSKGLSKIRRE